MRKIFIFICLMSISLAAYGQKISISGWVSDAETGEKLVAASAQELIYKTGSITDNYGFFSLKMKRGDVLLRYAYVGYSSDTVRINVTKDTAINIALKPATLKEVVIVGSARRDLGVVQIPVQDLKSRPVIFGEPDVIKALALTPGVKQGTEATTGLYIRGGTPDQNNILLDGATVYNTSHLFGFISIFNPDALKSVTLYKGKMPAKFGGRLSSVLDVVMKEGSNKKRKSEISIGIISFRFCTEGPIKKNKSSYFLSVRTSYLGLLALPGRISYHKGNKDTYANYWMYDVNGKVNFDLGRNSHFYVSFYTGKDTWKARSMDNSGEGILGLDWGNQTLSLRYNKLLNQKISFLSQATVNRYNYGNNQGFVPKANGQETNFTSNAYVQDVTFKNSIYWIPHSKHALEAGVEIAAQQIAPIAADLGQSTQAVKFNGLQQAVFIEDNVLLTKRLTASLGIRLAAFNTGGKQFIFWEPRTNLKYTLDRLNTIEVSFRKNYQPLHLLTSSSIGLPNDVWVPATNRVSPANSRQVSGGWHHVLERLRTNFSIEAYYRDMNDLIDYKQGLNFFSSDKDWQEIIVKNGKGRAYGFECMLQKTAGRLSGWASYTLAWNERRFAGINRGKWFPHQYDRRHEFSLTGSYQISKQWTASANFVFTTGNAFTAPSYLAVIYYDPLVPSFAPIFTGKNNRRGPVYHRLDISMSKSYISKRGLESNWAFGVYNTYAHNNPFYLAIDAQSISNPTTGISDKLYINYTVGSIFNFIPSISYGIKF